MADPPQPGPPMATLRLRTRPHHERAENVPLMQALFHGSASREDYVRWLRTLAIAHAGLERQLAGCDHPAVGAVWRDDMRRLPDLLDDLRALDARRTPDSPDATDAVLALVDRIMLAGGEDPPALLGYLYVLEGSRNGAELFGDTVTGALELGAGAGTTFLTRAARDRKREWEGFSRRMNAALSDPDALDAAAAAAGEIFDALTGAYAALDPVDPATLATFATTLNPEAGRHPVPAAPAVLEAVFRAARRCWDAFGYYAWRYPRRGPQFADSDCAWLASMADMPADALTAQVDWLAGLLARRGMPSHMLEAQLRMLAEELRACDPPRTARADRLVSAADALASRRRAAVPEDTARRLAAEFDAADPDWPGTPAGLGEILVEAVCDEAAGRDGAVAGILDWAEAHGAPASWLTAARQTVHQARRAAEGTASSH